MCRLQGYTEDCVNFFSTDADNWIVLEEVKYLDSLLLSKD